MTRETLIRLIQCRAMARMVRDFALADEVKAELIKEGVQLIADHKDGTSDYSLPQAVRADKSADWYKDAYYNLRAREHRYSARIAELVAENLRLRFGDKNG